MLGNGKKNIPRYVDPKGFIKLYNRYATVDCIYRAQEIADEYKRSKQRTWGNEPTWDYMSMLGAVFEAGRTQGKREERLKHI